MQAQLLAWIGIGLLSASQSSSRSSVSAEHSLIDLGALPGGTEAWAFDLNDRGQVAVSAQYDSARRFHHAALWDRNGLTDLGQLSTVGFHSFATGINRAGHVVGGSLATAGFGSLADRAFLYDGTSMSDLGALPGGAGSYAFDINDAGDVVGRSDTDTLFQSKWISHAVLWADGNIVDLGTLGGLYSRAQAINRSRQVVGASLIEDGPLHAFLWEGTMTDLGTLGGPSSEAHDINDAGQIVGFAQNEAGARRAFLFENGAMRDLGALPGAHASEAYAISATGQVVGTSWVPGSGWTGGTLVDLNTWVEGGSDWKLQVARGINEAGWIVGYGRYRGATRAFLLRAR